MNMEQNRKPNSDQAENFPQEENIKTDEKKGSIWDQLTPEEIADLERNDPDDHLYGRK